MNEQKNNRARQQAAAQYESICEMLDALDPEKSAHRYSSALSYDRCVELLTSVDIDPGEDDLETLREAVAENIADGTIEPDDYEFDEEEARRCIDEDPLSVDVRSGWTSPGCVMDPYEYQILLCTGGPAVRIKGDLDQFNQPDTAEIEYQDWFTGWEWFHETEEDILLEYARCFYYGD